MMKSPIAIVGLLLSAVLFASSTACSGTQPARAGEGVAASAVPPEVKEEYALFAQRCSKCHSLSRALNNGDHDPQYWARYVSRMRRQPSSGIAPEDEPPILRYLNFYSSQLRAQSGAVDAGGQP